MNHERKMAAVSLMVALGLLSLGAASSMAATTSPGKSSAYSSTAFVPLPPFPTPVLTATIAKGKKKTVLEISTTLSATPVAPVVLALQVIVNGVVVEPGPGWVTAQDCTGIPAQGCNLTTTSWLDIDAAELANPGVFVGQPLVVTFLGGGTVGVGTNSGASLAVRVQKK